ncbi:MAG: hypothetical protein INF97_15665 [Roseomonas sp.]|nr:hypothetical protein [Roseomonas sp.]
MSDPFRVSDCADEAALKRRVDGLPTLADRNKKWIFHGEIMKKLRFFQGFFGALGFLSFASVTRAEMLRDAFDFPCKARLPSRDCAQ